MKLVDTHCHIHSANFELSGDESVRVQWLRAGKPDPDEMIRAAAEAGVSQLICVGTTVEDSRSAVEFVQDRPNCYAAVGIHPHEAKRYVNDQKALDELAALAKQPKVVAIGECGLDYYYNHSQRNDQLEIFRFQLGLAAENNLPLIFHVREAYQAFVEAMAVFDYTPLSGVVHSFTGTVGDLSDIQDGLANLHNNIYFGLNGIMTFTKRAEQLEAARAIALDRLVLETDSPFLTPAPFRGKINEPKYVRVVAEALAELRGEDFEVLARQTTNNALKLFGI